MLGDTANKFMHRRGKDNVATVLPQGEVKVDFNNEEHTTPHHTTPVPAVERTHRAFNFTPIHFLISFSQLSTREDGQTITPLHPPLLTNDHNTLIAVNVFPRPICKFNQ